MASPLTLIINPKAGEGRRRQKVLEAAARRGVCVCETNGCDSISPLLREAGQRGGIALVAGGDGTISAAVNAAMECDPPPTLAILPVGSANDFATSIGLEPSLDALLDLIETGTTRTIDLIRVRGSERHYLLNAATVGMSFEIHEAMDDEMKHFWGRFAYARAAAKVTPRAATYHMEYDADGQPMAAEVYAMFLCNGSRVGGVQLIPGASPDDGMLDVLAVRKLGAAGIARLLFEFLRGKHLDDEAVVHLKARRISLASEPPIEVIGDGDEIGPTPMTFEIVPSALRVIAPPATT